MAGVGPSLMVKKAGGEEYCSSSMNILLDLPPGFRFHPTDEEIITHYLTHKVMNNSFSARAIGEVDLNKCEPWDLPKKAKMGEKEWYFFCQRDRKYPTGMRTNRATESGYWKATGKDKEIYNKKEGVGYKGKSSNSRSNNCLIGMKKTLVFYKGRAPKGEKSNWVMHEYRLEGKFSYYNFPKAAKDEWVVCRVFHKNTGIKSSPIITGLTRTNSFGNDDHRHLLLDYECRHDNNNSLPPLMVMDFPNNYSNNQGPTAAGSSFADGEEEEIKGTATASSTRSSELEDGGDYDYLSYFDSSANPNINDVDQYDQMQKQQEDQLCKINQFMPHAMAMPTSSSSNPTPQSDFIFYPAAYQNQIQQLPNPPPPPVFPFQASPRDDHIINSSSINYLHQKERIGMGVIPIIPLIPGSSSSFKKINMGDDDQALLRALAQKHETLSTDDDDDDDMLEKKHCKMEQFSSSNNQYCCQSSMMSASQDTGLSTETSSAVISKNNMGTSSSRSYHEDKLELEDPSVLGPISDLDYIWNRPNY